MCSGIGDTGTWREDEGEIYGPRGTPGVLPVLCFGGETLEIRDWKCTGTLGLQTLSGVPVLKTHLESGRPTTP